MTVAALVLYLVGLLMAFGLRTWLQIRRTGSSGFHGISGRPGSLRWWAGVLFILALVLGAASLILAVTGMLPAPAGLDALAVVGLIVAIAASIGVFAAQSGMGTSWRIGVKETERTELVTDGVFTIVRNPIFSAMVTVQVGLTVVVPTWLSLASTICLITAVELQVRLIEEPYLLQVHGDAYRTYAAKTGRFVPGIGRFTPVPEVTR